MDEDREGKIKQGNERVLKARLDDAHFFWEQDLKDGLETMAERLSSVVWQEQLGTLAEKSQRVGRLAEYLVKVSGVGSEDTVKRAAQLYKADLTSEMVREKEFSSLQGLMGREYALASGSDKEVAAAIFEHYLPRFAGDMLPETPTGQILALADKLDSIVGCFGAGLMPTGSEDPYALRRQAMGVVRILVEKGIRLDLESAVVNAAKLYDDRIAGDVVDLASKVYPFLEQRLETLLVDAGYRPDLVQSVTGASLQDPARIAEKVEAIKIFETDERFSILVTVFKRAWNIVAGAGLDTGEVDEGLLKEQAELALFAAYQRIMDRYGQLWPETTNRDVSLVDLYQRAMGLFLELAGPINVFFDEVMVMVDDEKLKQNRLNMLGKITGLFLEVADFSQLVVR